MLFQNNKTSHHFRSLHILNLFTIFFTASLIILFLFQAHQDLRAGLGDDASQNLRSAFNFFSTGEYGDRILGVPGFRREPFPNFITSFYIKGFVDIPMNLDFASLLSSQSLLDQIVKVNLLWAFGLYALIWVLCRQLFEVNWVANIISAFVIYGADATFVSHEYHNLNTELQASFLMISFASVGLRFYRKPSLLLTLPLGFIGGLLILTKSSGMYVLAIVYWPLALLLSKPLRLYGRWASRTSRFVAVLLSLYFVSFAISFPWALRNKLEFDQFSISQGGGRVLLIRSEFNKMNLTEYAGAFYAYAPDFLQDDVFEKFLGFDKNQLKCSGSLQSLNRNLACDKVDLALGNYSQVRSFYQRGKRALPAILNKKYMQNGLKFSNDNVGKKYAINSFIQDPFSHLYVTIPMSWRGLWPASDESWAGGLVNFICMVSLIFVMPVIGLFASRGEWAVISLLPSGYFWFYAFLSHFRTRYSEPFIPLGFVAAFIMLAVIFSRFKGRSSYFLLKA